MTESGKDTSFLDFPELRRQNETIIRGGELQRQRLNGSDFVPPIPADRIWPDLGKWLKSRDSPFVVQLHFAHLVWA